MSDCYGADRATWQYWDVVLGLGEDLLPVVCQPGLTIAPQSALRTYGKVPSRFDAQDRVVGFPRWTQHRASDDDLEKWSSDSRLGICLQTRRIRALDVDIEDFDAAQTVRELLDEWAAGKGFHFSYRMRRNSAKFLTLFELTGEYAKQVLLTDHGAIELLMTGQQCVVAGSHPSGARYDWEGGREVFQIPLFDARAFEALKAMLRESCGGSWTEGRVRKVREAGSVQPVADDPVVDYLETHDWITGRATDRVDVRCPWAQEHTSATDASSTSYFLAGTGGYECGNFRCLHAHCIDKTTSDFLREIGWMADGFEDLTGGVSEAQVIGALIDGVPAVTTGENPLDQPTFDRQPKTSKIKPHANNLLLFLNWLCERGEGVRFDVFRDEIQLTTPSGCRAFTDADYTRLQIRAEAGALGFAPLNMELIRRVVHMVAQNRCFDSAQDWVHALPVWDGTRRVDTFCSTYLGALQHDYSRAVGRYLWTAMPGRILRPGSQADMAVILVSAQGTGKSSSVRAMAPMRDYYIDLSLSDRDADLARLTRGKTLVELSELRGLHTKEMDSIKSFVTRLDSEWVPKYFEMRTVYQRRFIMVGTTNNEEFLGDVTGERRWLPLVVGTQDIEGITRDHAQLWAEGVALYRTEGILWREAQRLGKDEHAKFTIQDVWVDVLNDWLHREEFGTTPASREFLYLHDVMKEGLNLDTKSGIRASQMRAADAMRRLGYRTVVKWVGGRSQRVWVRDLTTSYNLENPSVMEFF